MTARRSRGTGRCGGAFKGSTGVGVGQHDPSGFGGQGGQYTDVESVRAASGLYTALSGLVGALYYDPVSGVGLARSRADSVNAYFGALNPFSDWSWGAYFHEVGQFGIGEGKGFVNFAAGTAVYTNPALMIVDVQMRGRLSSPLAASNESQADGAETAGALATVASMLTGEVAASGRAAQRMAGAFSRLVCEGAAALRRARPSRWPTGRPNQSSRLKLVIGSKVATPTLE